MFFYKELEREIKVLKKRLKRLECSHGINNVGIIEYTGVFGNSYQKECCCGKILEVYPNKLLGLKARNDLMKELIALNEKEIHTLTPKKIWEKGKVKD